MSTGRSLDDELERQLAGAVIPEDEVDLFGDEEDTDGWLGEVPSPPEGSLDGSVVVSNVLSASGGAGTKLQGKLGGQDKKFSVRLLDSSVLDLCLKFVGNGSSVCVVVGCTTNHSGSSSPLKLEAPMVVIMKSKDRAFVDLTLEGSLVPANVLKIWESSSRTLNDWHEAFLAVDLQDEDGFDNQVLEIQRAETFKTPGKQRNSVDSLSSFVPYPSALRSLASKESLKRSPSNFPSWARY
jgi:hypothetical protein